MMFPVRASSYLLLLVVIYGVFDIAAGISCACGYVDNQGHLWREAIVSDFTQDAGAIAALGSDWIIASDNEPQSGTATANIQYVTANVMQFNDALGIQASAFIGGSNVDCGEIFTERDDILFGTFRMRAVVPTVPGVVFGFFSFRSDTEEQDIEFLSSDTNFFQQVHYTNQPGTVNGVVNTAAAKDVEINGADFTAFGEHRFDWLQSETSYYYNSALESTISVNVPTVGSEIVVNVWSNGDPAFSKGPPTSNAIATLQYLKLYFNSTTFTEAEFNSACSAAGDVAQCGI
ncbi:concanavalin A-like lectin/glucanase domain-containing protein [Rhodocollybia butyracea]|uniref:Concanavalin A-like lectin/glucanase domain-containing protein n=1 Tax=Rhodocollybia butyracea TaxID=206335 RepID=A0A9P5Q6F1_9AGAR|nr:concanavalin A-like lectin/glucanase domain-containing protein [Rhodocollybia butyracea]